LVEEKSRGRVLQVLGCGMRLEIGEGAWMVLLLELRRDGGRECGCAGVRTVGHHLMLGIVLRPADDDDD